MTTFEISGTSYKSPHCDTPEDLEAWADTLAVEYPTLSIVFYRFAENWRRDREMARENKKAHEDSVYIQPGRYWIGDPMAILHDDDSDFFECHSKTKLVYQLKNGTYLERNGHIEINIFSGNIAIVPDTEWRKPPDQNENGIIATYDYRILVTKTDAYLKIGAFTIDLVSFDELPRS